MVSQEQSGWVFLRDVALLVLLVLAMGLAAGLISFDGCKRAATADSTRSLALGDPCGATEREPA